MKLLSIILSLIITQFVLGQEAIMESIQEIRNQNTPEKGKAISTEGYWNESTGYGRNDFIQLCKLPADVELQIIDKKVEKERAVLTVHLILQGEALDRIYLYVVNKDGQWFLDGLNEYKNAISYFLEGKISGHFSPSHIPESTELEEIGMKLLNHVEDSVDLRNYLEKVFTGGSNHDYESLVRQFMYEDYDKATLSGTGYDEALGRGYLYFTQVNSETAFEGEITLFLLKTDNGIYKLNDRSYGAPYADAFLH
jgi:hypothetical protein